MKPQRAAARGEVLAAERPQSERMRVVHDDLRRIDQDYIVQDGEICHFRFNVGK